MYPSTHLLLLAESLDAAPLHYDTIARTGEFLRVLACSELRPVGPLLKWYDHGRGDLDFTVERIGSGVRLVAKTPAGLLVWAGPVVGRAVRQVEATLSIASVSA